MVPVDQRALGRRQHKLQKSFWMPKSFLERVFNRSDPQDTVSELRFLFASPNLIMLTCWSLHMAPENALEE